jgi:ABC-type Fe3+/spermidine/putrescine transport system ATPase subunit
LKLRKTPKAEVTARVGTVLDMVRLGGLGDRPASRLSGGQQQRVALARAIAFNPKALLLDEPLSNLDAKLRAEMRVELRELQQRIDVTSIYVTHDQEEALAISDRIIVMNGGLIEQVGTPADIYDRPRTRFVADFIGAANIIVGHVEPNGSDGAVTLRTGGGTIVRCQRPSVVPSGEVAVSVRTVYPELHRDEPTETTNVWRGRVARRVFLGDSVQYFVDWDGGAALSVRKPPLDTLNEGESVFVRIDPRHCVFVEN